MTEAPPRAPPSARSEEPFRRPVLVVLLGLGLASLVFATLSGRLSPPGEVPDSAQADSYSRSAVGHAAFVELLESLDIPVERNRRGTRMRGDAVLLLVEPRPWESASHAEQLDELYGSAWNLVVVLPKWEAREDAERPGWVDRLRWVDAADVTEILTRLELPGQVLRPGRPVSEWLGAVDGLPPELPRPQLLSGQGLRPVVFAPEGVLVGLHERRYGDHLERIVVVSDPDLLSTHGLGRGGNAQVAVDAVTLLREGDDALILDETLHGFRLEASLVAELLRFPLVIGLAHLGLLALVVLWAGVARFGAPEPLPATRPTGRRALIENTVQLLVAGGHHAELVRRYLRSTTRRLGEAFHIGRQHDEAERLARLAGIARRRGLDDDPETLTELLRRSTLLELADAADDGDTSGPLPQRRALSVARRIHRWHEDMLHGA